jgi:translation initiation factor 6 (eIF-6)
MATRVQFENNNEVGVFARLTNAYCLVNISPKQIACRFSSVETEIIVSLNRQVGIGGSENFYSVFESELADHIPVVHCSIAGTRIVGRMCVGEMHLALFACPSESESFVSQGIAKDCFFPIQQLTKKCFTLEILYQTR